jgi:hypothetical protein
MKNFAFQNRVLQRDRVLERRVLEREYCTVLSIVKHKEMYSVMHHYIYYFCTTGSGMYLTW